MDSSRVNTVMELFDRGKRYNCSQAILAAYCEDLGLDKETALRLA
jgi:uncharacterized protein YycO